MVKCICKKIGGNNMIGQYTLKMLCEKYRISSDKLVNKNNNILTNGEYQDIDSTLDYLVNILKISSNNIEKCPSILYRNVKNIRENVDFIRNCNIHFSNIESCLHVLNSEPFELKMTYEYVKENYGLDIIVSMLNFLFFFFFLCPCLWHTEVPRLGVKLEPQLQAYTTATATPDGATACSNT